MIKLLYNQFKIQINVNGILTHAFGVHRGVKQGCLLNVPYCILWQSVLSYIKHDLREPKPQQFYVSLL